MRQKIIAVLLLCLIGFGAESAYAVPVRWTIGSVYPGGAAWLSDNGRLTGGFTYDADSGIYSDFNLRTSSTLYTGALYTIYMPYSNPTIELTAFASTTGGLLGQRMLYLYFPATLTNAGGHVDLFSIIEGVCADISPFTGGVCLPSQDHTANVGSYLTGIPIPVPSAVWLFGSALGVMGWLRRKAAA